MRYGTRQFGMGGMMGGDYPMVKLILAVNGAVWALQWLAAATIGDAFVYRHLALSPQIWRGEVWQLVTYMFLHSTNGPWHLLFNMLAVWMFGRELEMVWGSREFLKFYFVCGIGAGLTFLVFSQGIVVGASGAVFGILLAFGMTFPDQIILMSLLFPIKAKYMVLIYGVITFLNIARPGPDGIAHFAHLGGMVFGFVYLKKEMFRFKVQGLMARRTMKISRPKKPGREPAGTGDKSLRERVDAILDKINAVGYDKLTAEEKRILMEASEHLSSGDKSRRPQ